MLQADYRQWRESLLMRIVWRLPHRVIYWAVIRAATVRELDGPPSEHLVIDVLDAWERRGRQG